MAHDMLGPVMAAAMEQDIRRRFGVALILTISRVFYPSRGRNFFEFNLPDLLP
jgi:hypothetical protein